MVEFALSIPFLLLLLFGIYYFGRAFYLTQVLAYAAQEGARVAARMPNLDDPAIRDALRGFSSGGQESNPQSVIHSALGAAHLLSSGSTGDLPRRAAVRILPWDSDGSSSDFTPAGTVAVRIEYPFELLGNPFSGGAEAPELAVMMGAEGSGEPVRFFNVMLSERATAAQEVYQEVN